MQRLPKISWESLLSRDFRPHLSMLCSALQYRQNWLQALLLLKAVHHSPLQFEARPQHLEDVRLLGSVRVGTGAGALPQEAVGGSVGGAGRLGDPSALFCLPSGAAANPPTFLWLRECLYKCFMSDGVNSCEANLFLSSHFPHVISHHGAMCPRVHKLILASEMNSKVVLERHT